MSEFIDDKLQRLGTVKTFPAPRDAGGPRILSSAQFVEGFVPPDYVIDGIIQHGFLYSMTGPTGGGKTAIALRLAAHVALEIPLGHHEVKPGKCLLLIGENADDVRARWIALAEEMRFDAQRIDVHFLPQIVPLRESLPFLKAEAERIGPLALVVVDTSAAFFQGAEENSNVELGDHARMLRALTGLNGNPCVLVNCHPTKNALSDSLSPRGGGAFIAEVDGNLTCSKSGSAIQLHWFGKFRGPDFDPLSFELISVKSDRLKDTRGRHVPTVIAKLLDDSEQAAKASMADDELRQLLTVMAKTPGASIAQLAEQAGWKIARGSPHKSKVSRLLGELRNAKLAAKGMNDKWSLTPAGQKAAKGSLK